MKKINKTISLFLVSISIFAGCAIEPSVNNVNKKVEQNQSVFQDGDFTFSIKDLSAGYVDRKLRILGALPAGSTKDARIVRFFDFAKIKGTTAGNIGGLMTAFFAIPANSALKTIFSSNPGIVARRSSAVPFDSFSEIVFSEPLPPTSYNVTTIAGSGTLGDVNGVGASAQFFYPRGIAFDSIGNMFLADTNNNKIKVIDNTSNHNVSTIAGTGNSSDVNGAGNSAQFSNPNGIVFNNTTQNIFIIDTNNHKIKMIDNTPSHNVTTIAGSGTYGDVIGAGASAQFKNPRGMAIDSSGNIFIADTENNKIKKIDTSFNVTTIAGTGAFGDVNDIGTSAQFSNPIGIAVDSTGNLFITDSSHKIKKIDNTPAHNVTTIAGSVGGDAIGLGTDAKFYYPRGIAVDSTGIIFVADHYNHKIKRIDNKSAHNVTTIAGSVGGDAIGLGTDAKFYYPQGLTLDSAGNIFVVDFNQKIKKITPAG